jgi:hypothetical protein
MITGVVFASNVAVDTASEQVVGQHFAEEKVVKPETMILLIAIWPVRPEGIDTLFTEHIAESIAPSITDKGCERLAGPPKRPAGGPPDGLRMADPSGSDNAPGGEGFRAVHHLNGPARNDVLERPYLVIFKQHRNCPDQNNDNDEKEDFLRAANMFHRALPEI